MMIVAITHTTSRHTTTIISGTVITTIVLMFFISFGIIVFVGLGIVSLCNTVAFNSY